MLGSVLLLLLPLLGRGEYRCCCRRSNDEDSASSTTRDDAADVDDDDNANDVLNLVGPLPRGVSDVNDDDDGITIIPKATTH